MASGRRVWVAGLGAVAPSGVGAGAFFEGLLEARQGAAAITLFPTASLRSHAAALVTGFDPKRFIAAAKVRRLDAASRYAIAAAREAFADAGLETPPLDRDGSGSVLGSASAGASPVREFLEPVLLRGPGAALPMVFPNTVGNAPSSYVAIELGLGGPNATVSQKECSGLMAIAQAAGYVAEGRAGLMIAGGVDEIAASIYGAMDRLGVLQRPGTLPEESLPFVEGSRGMVLGEGAYALLLSSQPSGSGVVAVEIAGTGVASDAVAPDLWPGDPAAVARAIEEALSDAGVAAREVDLVIASANGVALPELVEGEALARVFRDGHMPPVTGVKRLTGDGGSSSAAAAAAGVLAIRSQRMFPAVGREPLRVGLAYRPLREARAGSVQVVLVLSIATGGTAAAMVLRRA